MKDSTFGQILICMGTIIFLIMIFASPIRDMFTRIIFSLLALVIIGIGLIPNLIKSKS